MGSNIVPILDKIIVILGQGNIAIPLIKDIIQLFKNEYPGDIPEFTDLQIIQKAKLLNDEEIEILKTLLKENV